MTSVQVAVRVRPQALREVDAGEARVVHVDKERGVISVTNLKVPEFAEGDSRERTRYFSFDACYDLNTPQDDLFHEVGQRVLDSLASGYNACVLAYGQSGSGKTFTMMGRQGQPGLTPRICQALFSRLNLAALKATPSHEVPTPVRVAVCFLEIHKERVRDLLALDAPPLRVREHPRTGPYVPDLSEHVVQDAHTLMSLLAEGNSRRCTARSGEHARSSRSHAVFTISCPQGRAHLVDLAGSERAEFSCRERREEGANINKSLATLGNVISALAERPRCCHVTTPRRCSHAHAYVPYRDSVLTWLLRDSLGGNAKTFMIATVSPSSGCYSETVNTLRYAQRAKRIVNQPVVNSGMPEETAARTIRELQAEVSRLRAVLAALQGNGALKQSGLSNGRGDTLTRRWIARWYANQLQESSAAPSVHRSTSTHHAHMGQRSSTPSPDVSAGVRSSSQLFAEEASEATERASSAILLPVMFVDHANTARTDLKRTFSSCELVYRRPVRGLSRVQRRYASHDSIPHHTDQNLSPGGSENSLASSSSSLESQRSLDSRLHRSSVIGTSNTYKKKGFKSAIPIRIPTSRSSSDSERRLSTASSSSVPDLPSRTDVKKKKADIVAAVTQRLYPKKKVKSTNATEEIEHCSRASLRDLSKRLLKKENIKTEAETQTKNETKEASVGTDKINNPPEPIHAFITSEVFVPTMCLCQFDSVVVGDGANVQPDLLGTCRDSPCSGSATTSPSVSVELPPCFKHCEDECFSDDSLDSKRDVETDSLDGEKPCLWKVVHLSSGQDFLRSDTIENNNNKSDENLNKNNVNMDQINNTKKLENNNSESVIIEGELPSEENWEISVLIGADESDLENSSVNLKISNEKIDDENTLFNGLPLSSEESEQSRPPSSDDNNSCPSPVSSDAASTGSDSSSGDDFVYYLQAPDDKGATARCLYTIAENSEHSDHSESMEPSLSPPLHAPLSKSTPENTFVTPTSLQQSSLSYPLNIVATTSSAVTYESASTTPPRAHTVLTSSLLGSPPLSSTHENVPHILTKDSKYPQNVPQATASSSNDKNFSLSTSYENSYPNTHSLSTSHENLPQNSNDKNYSLRIFEPQSLETVTSSLSPSCETKVSQSHEALNLIKTNSARNSPVNFKPENSFDSLNASGSQIDSGNSSPLNVSSSSEHSSSQNSPHRPEPRLSIAITSHHPPDITSSSPSASKSAEIQPSVSTQQVLNLASAKNVLVNNNNECGSVNNVFKNQLSNVPFSSRDTTYNVTRSLESQNTFVNSRNNVLKNPLCNIYEPLSSPKLVSRSPSPKLSFDNASQSPVTYFNNNISSQSPNLFQVDNAAANFSFNYTQKQNTFETETSNPKFFQSNLKSRSSSPNLINLNTPPNEKKRDFTIRSYSPSLKSDNLNLNNSYTLNENIRVNPPQLKTEGVFQIARESVRHPLSKFWPPDVPQDQSHPLQAPIPPHIPAIKPVIQPVVQPTLPSTIQTSVQPVMQVVRPPATTLSQAFTRGIIHNQQQHSDDGSVGAARAYSQARTARDDGSRQFPYERRSVSPEQIQTVQWADPRQRQFLNVSVVAPTRALPASVGLQDTSTASEDSITFVYVGPARRHAPPVLLELVRRSVGGRGLQRSVSLDSATRALARLSQRRRSEVVRACSMDTLVPEETYAFLEPARRERAPHIVEIPRRSPPRRSFSPATPSDSEVRSTDDDFDDTPPPELPRVTGQDTDKTQRWMDMKQIILGQKPRPKSSPSPPLPTRQRAVGKKAVSWSDVSGCGLLSSPSTHSLPSPTSMSGSPKPIIKKTSLAPVPQSPVPSPTSRSPQTRSPDPERHARRDRLYLDLQTPQRPQRDINRLSPDFRRSRLSPEPPYYRPEWTRERSMSAPSSPYRDDAFYTRLREEHSPSPGDWRNEARGPSVSAPSTPLSGSPGHLNFQRFSRSPPRCSSPRCHSLGDVSEVGRDAESLRAFLAQATTLLHSLSDLSRFLETQTPPQRSSERAVQTEDDHHCCSPRTNHARRCHERTEPIPIQPPVHCCSHVRTCCTHGHTCPPPSRSSRSWYEPSVLERQLEASCVRLETSLQQPAHWESMIEEPRLGASRALSSPTPRYTPLPPLPSRSVRPHFSPRAYMRHLLGVRRRIIEAARQDQRLNPDDL